ncbi:MAG: Lrp/AsnC family transcriptional regulator [Christensenellales bacterium]|jgi:DNA-binding Lrp family transcriptional regulator
MVSTFQLHILEILVDDARTSPEQIACMTGRSLEDVKGAIADMEDKRIIVKYPALINWDRVETEQVEAVIEVRVTPQRGAGFDAIASEIYLFEEVSSVYLMSGAYDLMVLVKGRSLKQLAQFVAEKLSTLENVNSTATHFVLKKYKVDGVLVEGGAKDRRLAVSP